MWYQEFENESEREEREAVQAGTLAYAQDPRDDEPITTCCPSPGAARANLCACGGVPYV